MDGTSGKTVTAWRSMRSITAWTSRSAPWGARTSAAPATRGQNVRVTETSKPNGLAWRQTSPGATPRSSFCARSRLQIPRWVFMTPLALPVEPDV